jgi:hypothetical protein
VALVETGFFSSTSNSLSPSRANLGHPSRFYCGNSPRQDKHSPEQWYFPTNHWFKQVPLCQQFKAFFETSQCQSHSEYHQGSRSSKAKSVLSTLSSYPPPVRFQSFRSGSLRQVHRGSRSRLHPHKKGAHFLTSFTLSRVSLQRDLAWYFRAETFIPLCVARVYENMSKQNSTQDLSYPSTSRFLLLRSQICSCRYDPPSDQTQNRK